MWGCYATIATTFALAVAPAFACSCGGLGKYGCQVPSADLIVLARVLSVEQTPSMPAARHENGLPRNANARQSAHAPEPQPRVWGSVIVTLDIVERFSGESNDPLAIRTENDTAACGYRFQVGREYLVFATQFQGNLTVNFCSATQPAHAAASRIRQLRAIRDGTALPSLFGSVLTHPLEQGEDSEEYIRAVPNLTVVAQSDDREYRTKTADDGVYEFHGMPRGEYHVQVEAPAGRVVLWGGGVERVRTPAGLEARCPVDFLVFGDGRLSGTVIDSRGQPLAGTVTAEYVDAKKPVASRIGSIVKEGRFEIVRLWPGRYRLEFLGDEMPSRGPFYYPGTRSRSAAALIEVGNGTKIDNLQLVVF